MYCSEYSVPSEVATGGVKATSNAIGVLGTSIPNFSCLVEDVGATNDSYAYRGKVRSMRDVMNTLFRHTALLLDDLDGLENQEAVSRGSILEQLQTMSKVSCNVHTTQLSTLV